MSDILYSLIKQWFLTKTVTMKASKSDVSFFFLNDISEINKKLGAMTKSKI